MLRTDGVFIVKNIIHEVGMKACACVFALTLAESRNKCRSVSGGLCRASINN